VNGESNVFTSSLPRIVAFAGPPLSIAAGIIATWLTTHVHLLATFHIDQNGVAGTLTQGGIFAISTFVTWLGQQTWLQGHQIELEKAWDLWIESGAKVPPPGNVTSVGGTQVRRSAK
jgi:hypothetical protein